MAETQFTSLLQRLEAVTTRLEAMESPAGDAADAGSLAPMLHEFDQLLADQVRTYVTLAGQVGAPEVEAQAKLVQAAFEAQREMLLTVSKCSKPSPAKLAELCKPTGDLIAKVIGSQQQQDIPPSTLWPARQSTNLIWARSTRAHSVEAGL
jgi:hypothetical protein